MPLLWPTPADLRARRAHAVHRPAAAPAFASRGPEAWTDPRTGARQLDDRLLRHPAKLLAGLAAIVSLLAIALPGVDLAVSGWFADETGAFGWSRVEALIAFRDLNRILPPVLLLALVALLLVHSAGLLRHRSWPRPHQVLFVLTFYTLGPGLLVNGLKEIVGRARPRSIAEFGGPLDFTPAWLASSQCARNCSFPSGEAGSAVAMLAFVFLMPPRWRKPALILLVPFAIALSVNRIAFGAHFASDVLLSWLMVGAVMLALHPVFCARAAALDGAIAGSLSRLRRTAMERPVRLRST